MSQLLEILVTSDSENTLWTCCAWDPHTGTALSSWRGGGTAQSRTLGLLGEDYIAAAEKNKPLLQVWPLNSQQTVQGLRFVLPGRATALALSPDGCYCIAGVAEKIYLWQIASGSLMTIINRHYQPITVLKFTQDGRWFISAAEDGMVMVWSLATVAAHPEVELTTQSTAGRHDPVYVFSDHSLPVTDIAIGRSGLHARLASVSSDRSCRVYDLSKGEILITVIFDTPLSSVTFDSLELNLFVGNTEGKINKISLTHTPRTREHYVNDKEAEVFIGHSKAVSCLSVSIDGETLASGGGDEQVILWHIPSRQQIKSLRHKGAVTNVFFSLNPKAMNKQDFSPSLVLHSLERTLEKDSDSILEVEVFSKVKTNFWPEDTCEYISGSNNGDSEDVKEREEKLKEEIKTLKNINAKLYAYSVQNVIDDPVCNVPKNNKKRKLKNK